VDDDGTGGIEFSEFLKVILNQKTQAAERADERDTIDAFVAMGGSADKTGVIQTDKLVRVIQVCVGGMGCP
jgi:calmodulin